ncbi:MAG TPA: hypothetical protein PLO89_12055 [Spirochaetota bacterium]|nr:hypothetical protein [Spirochaetota bacterium]
MNAILRLRALFIISTIFASIGIWSVLSKLIQINSRPLELSGTEFINNPIKGKIRITGNFEYLSCVKEYMKKNGTYYAGIDNYYYTGIQIFSLILELSQGNRNR